MQIDSQKTNLSKFSHFEYSINPQLFKAMSDEEKVMYLLKREQRNNLDEEINRPISYSYNEEDF